MSGKDARNHSETTPTPSTEMKPGDIRFDPVLGVDIKEIVQRARDLMDVADLDGLEALQTAVNWKIQDRAELVVASVESAELLDRQDEEQLYRGGKAPYAVAVGMRIVPATTNTLFGPIPTTLSLPYGGTTVHKNARDTEVAAFKRVSHISGKLRAQVLNQIRAAGDEGMTAAELGAKLAAERGLPATDATCRYSCAPRVTELREMGLVMDSGKRRGRSIAWVVTDAGKAVTL